MGEPEAGRDIPPPRAKRTRFEWPRLLMIHQVASYLGWSAATIRLSDRARLPRGIGSDGHTADRRSIMARSPLSRRVLTKGPDANGLVRGCLPSEVADIRNVILSR